MTQHAQTQDSVDEYTSQYSADFVSKWDELINWELRKQGENGFFEQLLKAAQCHSVIDVSAGSGFHSVQLTLAGLHVVANDGSATMVAKAKANFERYDVCIDCHNSDWLDLDSRILGKFDAVVCLGSSLCHVFDEQDRRKVLSNFRSLLKPGGLLIVDQRNFYAILAGRFKASGNYYYCGTSASVTLGEVNDQLCEFRYSFDGAPPYSLKVYPLQPNQLKSEINASGFSHQSMYGDFRADFDMLSSDFIIHKAVAI
ncbi:class I SAM-dependent methyltransferase [Pseudomonas sp. KU26590]|uniref:class I SAM-dependent methyltransferase n=1 Tax=Pseudomonas sp. KU26590 TaxID=2991051 RepID=UPI00223E1699|nr:class I SAM-dependent methyltransferase [Pseudomonas sp. KU26590]UZJ58017.1 class I SAM-dependent methyltransferase [Pseudomonas sp. KU26590]